MAIDECYTISTPYRRRKSAFYAMFTEYYGKDSLFTNVWYDDIHALAYVPEPNEVQVLYKPKRGQLPLIKKKKEVKMSPFLKALMKNIETT